MLQSLIQLKLVAMAAALGLNTEDWKSPSSDMTKQVESLQKSMESIGKGSDAEVQSKIGETIKTIKDLADKGDKDAQFAVALFSQNQQGGIQQALDYYKKASDQGQLQATNNLGFIIAAGAQGDVAKQKEGVTLIKKAADAGNNPARRNMAQFYLGGHGGVTKDVAAAKKLLETAVAEKDNQAAYDLSQFYLGSGETDAEKAYEWLVKSADAGNASGLDTLGSLLFNGGSIGAKKVEANPAAALKKFQELAAQKNPVGLRKIAGVYEAGLAGEKKDFKKALENYSAAAQGNDALALFRLASFNDTGVKLDPKSDVVDVPRNDAAALSLYRLAAQNKLPIANYNVGVFYEQGRTVDRDLTKAFGFFQEAAQAGVALAMQKVGLYYSNGAGTVKDPVAAAGWFARSAAAGLPEGHFYYGMVTEAGLVDKESPYLAAANSYKNAYKSAAAMSSQALETGADHTASDALLMQSLLRIGNLYAKGVIAPKDNVAQPDLQNAYVYFQQALEVDSKNEGLTKLRDEVKGKLSAAQVKDAETTIAAMKKSLEEEITKAKAAAKDGAAPAPVLPSAEAAPVKPTGKKK